MTPSRRLLSAPGGNHMAADDGWLCKRPSVCAGDTTERRRPQQLFADPPPPALLRSLAVNDGSPPSTDHLRASRWRTELPGADHITPPSQLLVIIKAFGYCFSMLRWH